MRIVISVGLEGIACAGAMYLFANCIGLAMIMADLPVKPFPLLFYPLKLIGAL